MTSADDGGPRVHLAAGLSEAQQAEVRRVFDHLQHELTVARALADQMAMSLLARRPDDERRAS